MFDLTTQITAYLLAVFIFGIAFGWLLCGCSWSKQLKVISAEVDFWKGHLEQSRLERQGDIDKIALLNKQRENLNNRLATKTS